MIKSLEFPWPPVYSQQPFYQATMTTNGRLYVNKLYRRVLLKIFIAYFRIQFWTLDDF